MKVTYLTVVDKDGQTAAQRFASMTKAEGTFYIVGSDLYFVDKKITNGADLAQVVSDIGDINTTLTTLQDDAEVSGSIRNIVESYLEAENISIDDEGGYFTSTDVEGALAELAQASAGGVASKTVWFTDASSGQSDYAKVYKIWQGANAPDAQNDPATLVGTINVPKDLVVKSGSVQTVETADTPYTGAEVGDKYIDLEIQNQVSHLYIPVKDLVDVYTGGTTAEVTISVSAGNVITATIGKIAASKIITREAAPAQGDPGDPDYVPAVTEQNLAQKITELENAQTAVIEALDADVDASGTAQYNGTFVISGITEVDGVITAVDSVEVEAAGAAAAVLGTAQDTATANTVYGAKAAAAAAQSDVDALETYVGEIPVGSSATDIIGYVDESASAAIDDVSGSADIASVSNNVVTIKAGVTQTAAVIDNSSDSDIVLEEVAMTGAAADVSVTDSDGYFTGATVEAVLAEIGEQLVWNEV